MNSNYELSAMEDLPLELHEEIFQYLSGKDLLSLFLVSKLISSRASGVKKLMQKIRYNFNGHEDYRSGREYRQMKVENYRPESNIIFRDFVVQNFHNLEVLRLDKVDLLFDVALDDAMNVLNNLHTLTIKQCTFKDMTSTESWNLSNLRQLVIETDNTFFTKGKEITRKFECAVNITIFSAVFQDALSSTKSKVVLDFIASRSKLQKLQIDGSLSSKMFPKNVQLPIKTFSMLCRQVINCPEFISNCSSTLGEVFGKFSIETYRVIMESTKLKKLSWVSDELTVEEAESLKTNQIIEHLEIIGLICDDTVLDILIQKFDAVTTLALCDPIHATQIRSPREKIKMLYLKAVKTEESFWNQLKVSFPNIEDLQIAQPIGNDLLVTTARQNWKLDCLILTEVIDDNPSDSFVQFQKNCPSLQTIIIFVKQNLKEIMDGLISNGLQVIANIENGKKNPHNFTTTE